MAHLRFGCIVKLTTSNVKNALLYAPSHQKIRHSIDEKILLVDSLAAPFFEMLEYPCGHYGGQLVFLGLVSTQDDTRNSHTIH